MSHDSKPIRHLASATLIGVLGAFALFHVQRVVRFAVRSGAPIHDVVMPYGLIALFGVSFIVLSVGVWAQRPWAVRRRPGDSATAILSGGLGVLAIAESIGTFIGMFPRESGNMPWWAASALTGLVGVGLCGIAVGKWTQQPWAKGAFRRLLRDSIT